MAPPATVAIRAPTSGKLRVVFSESFVMRAPYSEYALLRRMNNVFF